jgi:protein-S-isoprenylcysteine O-methyltransferase Ste14
MMNKNRKSPVIVGLIRFIIKSLFFVLILFLSAGSLKYLNAWIFIGSFFLPDFLIIIYLAIKDPELLLKRLKNEETEKTQKIFIHIFRITALIVIILSGLDYRFQWSNISIFLVITLAIIMIFGFILSFVVMKQNSYASRVIEIQKRQKLIDTGLYSLIRHPMYLSAILIFCPLPLVLGSFYAFILSILIVPVLLVMRIMNEEKVLKKNLIGYTKYMKKVKHRLIPFIW